MYGSICIDMYGVLIKSPPESGLEVHPNRFRLSAPRDRFQTREAPGTENDTFREGMCKHKLSLPSFCIHMPLFSAIFSHHENTKHQQHVRQWCLIWMHCWVLNLPASVISSETGETWCTDFCLCLIGQEVTVLGSSWVWWTTQVRVAFSSKRNRHQFSQKISKSIQDT